MFNAMREFRQEIKARKQRRDCPHDEAGRAVLKMTVHDDSSFFSPYSDGASEIINDETAEFIRNSALGLSPKEQFALHVYNDSIAENERETYTKAIHSYFGRHFSDSAREMRLNTIQSVIMTLIGVISLVVMIVAEHLGVRAIWIECIDIFAWVFLWEAVDVFFLERTALRHKARRLLAFEKMDVIFHPISDLEKVQTERE